jgi:hypothetical protein
VRLIHGYEVEQAPNGAWWVRRPDRPHLAWRFATLEEAARFAVRFPAPAPDRLPPPERGAPPPRTA